MTTMHIMTKLFKCQISDKYLFDKKKEEQVTVLLEIQHSTIVNINIMITSAVAEEIRNNEENS